MSVQSLIDQIVEHPNSTFTPESISELEILSEPVLRQILLGMTSMNDADVQTLNSSMPNAAEIQTLLEDLAACQEDLQTATKEESRILSTLQKHGVNRSSVLTYNTNNAAMLNDKSVYQYVQTNSTPVSVALREGIAARAELRSKAIQEIMSCTSGVYTAQDLDNMPSSDLSKLSTALAKSRPVNQIPDYSALNVADNFLRVSNAPYNPMGAEGFMNGIMTGAGVVSSDPLEAPPRLF
jgi:DNA polymerase III gamma/tau subunit